MLIRQLKGFSEKSKKDWENLSHNQKEGIIWFVKSLNEGETVGDIYVGDNHYGTTSMNPYPIGSILYMSQNDIVVEHNNNVWLKCDGREVNIYDDYPELIGKTNGFGKISFVPKLTSNTSHQSSGYIASSSSRYDTVYDAYHAFDSGATTNFGTRANTFDVNGNVVDSEWLRIELPSSTLLQSYEMVPWTTFIANRQPKTWELRGSDDGANWDIIKKEENVTNWVSGISKTYILEQPVTYRYYDLHFLQTNGGRWLDLGKWRLYGKYFTLPVLTNSVGQYGYIKAK